MALAVVAVFCVAAISAVFASDESSAASSKTYNVYVEVIDADGTLESSRWVRFTAEETFESFTVEGTKALAAAGLSKMSFKISEKYGMSIGYDDTPGYNACYYAKDGAWAEVESAKTDYLPNTTIGFAVNNGYISEAKHSALPATEQSKWNLKGFGGDYEYIKLLEAAPTAVPEVKTYHTYVEVINEQGKVDKSKWFTFDGYKDIYGFIGAANLAYAADEDFKDLSISFAGGWASINYKSGFNGSYVVKDGKWTATADTATEYIASDAIAMVVWHGYIGDTLYDSMTDDEKKNWADSGMGAGDYHYIKVVSESVDGYKSDDKKSNTTLYIGIGVAVVVVLAAAAFIFIKKK